MYVSPALGGGDLATFGPSSHLTMRERELLVCVCVCGFVLARARARPWEIRENQFRADGSFKYFKATPESKGIFLGCGAGFSV